MGDPKKPRPRLEPVFRIDEPFRPEVRLHPEQVTDLRSPQAKIDRSKHRPKKPKPKPIRGRVNPPRPRGDVRSYRR